MKQAGRAKVARFIKVSLVATVAASAILLTAAGVHLQAEEKEVEIKERIILLDPSVVRWAFLSAAISVGVGSVAGGIAVAYVGAAAMGAVGEKPEVAGRALIFVGLAEGIAIYGLLVAIVILFKI